MHHRKGQRDAHERLAKRGSATYQVRITPSGLFAKLTVCENVYNGHLKGIIVAKNHSDLFIEEDRLNRFFPAQIEPIARQLTAVKTSQMIM